ncbi:TIGR02679 family protein [Brachybacterium vulturis]|uniref:TIGR02679 family protein n=1 Tax=Brachybacterium vulturis TaxID=2017484 RepID=A0A291GMD0_9MICO|nr:TIGR02679 family protein [Brachybacterium vulturis]ATG51358.1 TIGR02679 family protein [Brachybacterium vulturis]
MTEDGAAGSRRAGGGAAARAGDRAALDRLLGDPAMEWLVTRVRKRIPGAGEALLSGTVQLSGPTAEQRAAAVRVVGPPRRAGTALRVDLAVVEEILRRGPWPAGLADAVETLTGPVVDRRVQQVRETAAWEAARDRLAPVIAHFPRLARWWGPWCAAGGLKRVTSTEAARIGAPVTPALGADLVSRAAAVMDRLPAVQQPLPVLARETMGDAHGLDADRPLGRLMVAVARAAFMPDAEPEELSRRDVWASAGVMLSTVSSTALVLGVAGASSPDPGYGARRARAATATATSLEAMREARIPLVLTLDQVRSGGVRAMPRGSVVHACENPTIVEVVAERWARQRAEAEREAASTGGQPDEALGDAAGPVLVCISGQPSAAVVELLQILTAEGAALRYHGDFDWAGLRIARSLLTQVEWVPWRFTATDYVQVVREGRPSRDLTGRPALSPWDPHLAEVMVEWDLAVEEEAVADLLATDVIGPETLSRRGPRARSESSAAVPGRPARRSPSRPGCVPGG